MTDNLTSIIKKIGQIVQLGELIEVIPLRYQNGQVQLVRNLVQ